MSSFTMVPLYSHVCLRPRCRYAWQSLKERPGVCSECKSPTWDQPPKRRGRKPAEVTP